MKKLSALIAILVTACMLSACPTKPAKDPYGDPESSRDRADKAHKELDRETR